MAAIVAVTLAAAGARDAASRLRVKPLVSFSSLSYLLKILILTYYCYSCLITLLICLYYLFIYLIVTAV